MIQNDNLEKYRFIGDEQADPVVEFCAKSVNKDLVQFLLFQDTSNLLSHLPVELQLKWEKMQQFPAWIDFQKIKIATDFFSKYAQPIMTMLGLYSLPYCYAAAKGVKVLYFSERLRSDTLKRLYETAEFVWNVTQYDHWIDGKIFKFTQKIRFLHAWIRYCICRLPSWKISWGLPINQEDMAGTNLAFSLIVLRGLRKIQLKVSFQEAESYLHLWNVVGNLLGIDERLIPKTLKQASLLEQKIAERQFVPSMEGQTLTKKLVNTLHEATQKKISIKIIENYIHYLLGDDVSSVLNIKADFLYPTILYSYDIGKMVFKINPNFYEKRSILISD
ncbi:MAG: DUF2236 domain-containing protein [Cytophagales bacterium]|nr:DUF2236 domain-containing protein [Cytophagales bacterium]MDW8383140.1 oxygenase MpaB family protein [Flammeovirgaceae bacterium]